MNLIIITLFAVSVVLIALFREGEQKRKEIWICVVTTIIVFAFNGFYHLGHFVGAGDLARLQEAHAEEMEQKLQETRYAIEANLAPDLSSDDTYTVLGLGRDGNGWNVSRLAMVQGSKGKPQLRRLPQDVLTDQSLEAGVGLEYSRHNYKWTVTAPRSNKS